MTIQHEAVCGTLQSNDCFVRVMPSDKIELDLKSSVMQEFGAQIEAAVREVLEQFGVTACKLFLEDKGALDCTIKARVETVLRRANEK